MPTDWDVLVVGRSYAGLSAALVLGRSRRSVLVIGSGGPRNESVLHAHGLITQDGAAPAAVIEAAERELANYPTVELVDARVTSIEAFDGGGVRFGFGGRTSTAGRAILATGANDNPPDTPGLAEHWGRGVFTCPYCDGFEHAGMHLAIAGSAAFAPHLARVLVGWSDRITVFHDGLDDATAADLLAHGVQVEARPIVRVVGDGSSVSALHLADGSEVPIGALFLAQLPAPNNALAVQLGCAVDDNGHVVTDALRCTTVPGVWAVGDVASARANMAMGIADGTLAALGCNMGLLEHDWDSRGGALRPISGGAN